MIFYKPLIKQTIAFLALALSFFLSSAQVATELVPDSIKYQPVKLADIPLRLAETIGKTQEILKDLISDEEIEKLKLKNDSILNVVINSAAFLEEGVGQANLRYLENRLLQLQSKKVIVDNGVNQLTEIVKDLGKSLDFIKDEKIIWLNTKEKILELDYLETIVNRIDKTINQLDSTRSIISKRAEIMLLTLDRSSEVSINIQLKIADLNDLIKVQERKLLENQYPSIFNLNYSVENLKIDNAVYIYLKNEWSEIKAFVIAKSEVFILILLFFIGLVTLFIYYRKRLKKEAESIRNPYQKKLIIVLTKPISASVLLVILSIVLMLPDLPLIFRDLLPILLVIPLIVIIKQLLNRKLMFTVYGFAVIMVMNILLEILSPVNVLYRIYLLFMAIAEIYLIWHFLFYLIKDINSSGKAAKAIKPIGYVFLIVAVVGLYGSIMGNVMIAKDLLIALNTAVVVAALLYASLIILNGIIITVIGGKLFFRISFFKTYNSILQKKIVRILNIVAGFYFIVILLKQLNLWFILKDGVSGFFNKELNILNIEFSLNTVLVFIVVIYLSIIISRTIQIILEHDILEKIPMGKGLPHSISMIVKYSIITGGVLLAVSAAGMPLTSLTVLLGAFGVGIGFGLQNIFNNLVSGLILLFERPVQIGDTIEVGTLIGKVSSIGIRASNIKTFDGAEVIVPNGQLISNEVINWTLSDQQRRIEVMVGVSYNSDPHEVYKFLMQVLSDHPKIMQDPKPIVLFNELGESSLDFRLLFWTTFFGEWIQIRSEVIFKIFDLLKANDIEIPFPQRDINVRSIEQELKVITPSNK